jgi:hypothetical protein
MKKFLVLISFVALVNATHAQSISYTQLQRILNTWMKGKGATAKDISAQLHTISPKWKMLSNMPAVDGESTYYAWTALDTKSDSTALAVYIDKDATTVKYTLKYAFHSKALYDSMLRSLRASTYYQSGRITAFTDNSKGELTTTALANDSLPMASRIDFMLSDYDSNAGPNPRLFTVETFSRYIPIK